MSHSIISFTVQINITKLEKSDVMKAPIMILVKRHEIFKSNCQLSNDNEEMVFVCAMFDLGLLNSVQSTDLG